MEKLPRRDFPGAVTGAETRVALTRADVSVSCLYRVERSPIWAYREVPASSGNWRVLEPIPELWEPFLAELQAEANRKCAGWQRGPPTAALSPNRRRGHCVACGAAFLPTRRDARMCSGRCRVAAHRLRSAEPKETTHV